MMTLSVELESQTLPVVQFEETCCGMRRAA